MSTRALTHRTHCRARSLPPVMSSAEIDAVLTQDAPPRPALHVVPRQHGTTHRESTPRDAYPDPLFGAQPTMTAELPDPRVWVSRFALALLECLEGHRPPAQLAKHVDADVLGRLHRRYRASVRRGHRPGTTHIKRVRVCQPRDGVAEAALVTRIGGHPTPIALRLVGTDGRWVVTALEMI